MIAVAAITTINAAAMRAAPRPGMVIGIQPTLFGLTVVGVTVLSVVAP